MSSANASSDLSSEIEVDAFRRLFPLRFHERYLLESTHPDARKLGKARDTTLALGAVASADGSALAKIGCTTMLAAIKMEVMTPTTESPDEGCIVIDFHMHPICSSIVRPGKLADAAPVISNSGMIYFKELSLVSGKAAWMAYLIPIVSLNDDRRVVVVFEEDGGKLKCEPVNKGKRKLKLSSVLFPLTCILHKNYMLADLTAEEESIMETLVTMDCIALTRQSIKELQKVLNEAISEMEGD